MLEHSASTSLTCESCQQSTEICPLVDLNEREMEHLGSVTSGSTTQGVQAAKFCLIEVLDI